MFRFRVLITGWENKESLRGYECCALSNPLVFNPTFSRWGPWLQLGREGSVHLHGRPRVGGVRREGGVRARGTRRGRRFQQENDQVSRAQSCRSLLFVRIQFASNLPARHLGSFPHSGRRNKFRSPHNLPCSSHFHLFMTRHTDTIFVEILLFLPNVCPANNKRKNEMMMRGLTGDFFVSNCDTGVVNVLLRPDTARSIFHSRPADSTLP